MGRIRPIDVEEAATRRLGRCKIDRRPAIARLTQLDADKGFAWEFYGWVDIDAEIAVMGDSRHTPQTMSGMGEQLIGK